MHRINKNQEQHKTQCGMRTLLASNAWPVQFMPPAVWSQNQSGSFKGPRNTPQPQDPVQSIPQGDALAYPYVVSQRATELGDILLNPTKATLGIEPTQGGVESATAVVETNLVAMASGGQVTWNGQTVLLMSPMGLSSLSAESAKKSNGTKKSMQVWIDGITLELAQNEDASLASAVGIPIPTGMTATAAVVTGQAMGAYLASMLATKTFSTILTTNGILTVTAQATGVHVVFDPTNWNATVAKQFTVLPQGVASLETQFDGPYASSGPQAFKTVDLTGGIGATASWENTGIVITITGKNQTVQITETLKTDMRVWSLPQKINQTGISIQIVIPVVGLLVLDIPEDAIQQVYRVCSAANASAGIAANWNMRLCYTLECVV